MTGNSACVLAPRLAPPASWSAKLLQQPPTRFMPQSEPPSALPDVPQSSGLALPAAGSPGVSLGSLWAHACFCGASKRCRSSLQDPGLAPRPLCTPRLPLSPAASPKARSLVPCPQYWLGLAGAHLLDEAPPCLGERVGTAGTDRWPLDGELGLRRAGLRAGPLCSLDFQSQASEGVRPDPGGAQQAEMAAPETPTARLCRASGLSLGA